MVRGAGVLVSGARAQRLVVCGAMGADWAASELRPQPGQVACARCHLVCARCMLWPTSSARAEHKAEVLQQLAHPRPAIWGTLRVGQSLQEPGHWQGACSASEVPRG